MRELLDWVSRLHSLVDAGDRVFAERLRKLSAPSTLSFDNRIARVVAVGDEIHSFGSAPSYLSVLAWPERADRAETLEDHAIGAQLGALLTIASNRRVQIAATDVVASVEGTTKRIFIPAGLADRSLNGPLPADLPQQFEDLLSSFLGLSADDQDAIGASAELHYAAVQLCDVDPNAAYALLIAGIERLSSRFGSPPSDWNSWEDAKRFDEVFSDIGLRPEQTERLREELLANRNLRLRQTFASYVTENLNEEFWQIAISDFTPSIALDPNGDSHFGGFSESGSRPIAAFVPRDEDALRPRLLASYDRRSSYVHSGSRADPMDEIVQLVGGSAERRSPLPFCGVRAVLRYLLLAEMDRRSEPATLPRIKLVN